MAGRPLLKERIQSEPGVALMATEHSSEVESTALVSNDLARTLKTLAAPQRLQIVGLLGDRQLGASELSAALGLSRAQVGRHLRALLKTGLVVASDGSPRKRGERYRLEPRAVESLNSSYFGLVGHRALPMHAGHPRPDSRQEGEELTLAITPPPEACQTCRYSYYVYDLVANLERQLEDSRQYQAQLRHMSSSVLTAQEEERKRIARELHDDTAQALTSMLVRLRLLDRALADDEAKSNLGELRDLAASTLEGVRRMALDLRPSALDDLGLVPALKWYAENLAQSQSIEVRFLANGLKRRLPPELELVLYRVAQEALTNVAKHARASRVTVELERDGLWVRLAVEDDGIGFNVEKAMTSKERGLGLFGMQERLALVRGKFHVESQPRQGTKLVAEVPLHHPPPTIGG